MAAYKSKRLGVRPGRYYSDPTAAPWQVPLGTIVAMPEDDIMAMFVKFGVESAANGGYAAGTLVAWIGDLDDYTVTNDFSAATADLPAGVIMESDDSVAAETPDDGDYGWIQCGGMATIRAEVADYARGTWLKTGAADADDGLVVAGAIADEERVGVVAEAKNVAAVGAIKVRMAIIAA